MRVLKSNKFSTIVIILLALGSYSCAQYQTAYHMDDSDKQRQQGYHANEANRVLDTNRENKNANSKAAEKKRQAANEKAAEKSKAKKGSKPHTFY
jgi:hypothetical protein